jgi:hypothetical protein
MHIEFIARDKQGRQAKAADAKTAVALFLRQYKSHKITVSEYRDGVFTISLGCRNPDDCFTRSFSSRAEAQAFCQDTAPDTVMEVCHA